MKNKHYNVFIIGSGVAGQTVAKACAKNNLKVAIADNREYGGTCANRGCDPKKIMLEFSDLIEKSNRLKGLGVSRLPKIDWKQIQKFKKHFTQSIPQSTEENLKELGINLYHQSPVFKSENKITVEGKTITADYFVIATGKIPRPLHIKGKKYIGTSDAVLNLKKIPKSASFIGSGYIGMEFACMLAILGCKVTVFDHGSNALSNFDDFLVDQLVDRMKQLGVHFIFNAEITTIKELNKNLRIDYTENKKKKRLKSRKVFNTAGRIPAIAALNLEKANIDFNDKGVIVNDYLQSKSNEKVYACGDVSSLSVPLTPLSGLQGHIVGENILNKNAKKFEHPLVPSTVFTNPNLSSVGYSEAEAKKRFKNVTIFYGDASDWFNAKKGNEKAYAYKIIANQRTEEIIGAHILGQEANENINLFTMAINNKMTITSFKRLIFTYPSYSNDTKAMFKNNI